MSAGGLNVERLETEVAVIGGGGAGLAAAVAAAEKGVSVIVLEKRHSLGGNSALARGLFGVESPTQKRLYIDVRRDDAFKLAMKYARWKIDPKLVRTFIDRSGDTIQWLEEKGVAFDVLSNWPNQFPRTWHCPRGKGFGAEIIKVLAKNCEACGIRVLTQTRAREILTRDNKIVGILATTRQGQTLRIMASAIIIATGGFGGNVKMLKTYFPYYNENIHLAGVPNAGDGIVMARKVGAAETPVILHLEGCAFVSGEPATLTAAAQQPFTVWVNKRGERFIDESYITRDNVFEAAWAVLRQPDGMHYSLFDESIKRKLMEDGIEKGHRKSAGAAVYPPGTKLRDLEHVLQAAAKKGAIVISNSWDEIAKWMGVAPECLRVTIEEYNLFCDRGRDEIFAKERRYLLALRTPPYYAVKCGTRLLGTIGSIKVNHRMEAIDREGNPIPGLYAAGIDTGDWEPDTYNLHLSGSTFGFAVNSGRIAGENAADCVEKRL